MKEQDLFYFSALLRVESDDDSIEKWESYGDERGNEVFNAINKTYHGFES